MIQLKPPFFRWSELKKYMQHEKFIKKHISLSSRSHLGDNLARATRFLEGLEYDILFVGSDTVWEARESLFCPVQPNIFYLPEFDKAKKISFAASSDPIDIDFIKNKDLISQLAEYIRRFDYITVRDNATRSYLNSIGINSGEIHYMPDPTLIYDFESLVNPISLRSRNPIAGIAFAGVGKKYITLECKRLGYDVFDFSTNSLNGIKISHIDNVSKRLGVYRELDLMITDRFHGSIFTLKLGDCPVVFLETEKKWPMRNSKGRDLFDRLGLEHMVLRVEGESTQIEKLEPLIDEWKFTGSSKHTTLKALKDIGEIQLGKIKQYLK